MTVKTNIEPNLPVRKRPNGFEHNMKLWLLTILAFATLGALLVVNPYTSSRRISDADFDISGAWQSIELARYSEGERNFHR